MKKKTIAPLLIGALLAMSLSSQVLAQEKSSVSLKNVAEMERKVLENGVTVIKRIPVSKAVPDSEIIYTTTFKNLIDKPVGDIVVENPLPNDSVYKAGSAQGDNTVITYSANGGKTYGLPAALTVKGKDGKERPALPSEYTHIRWAYRGTLAVGKSSDVSFRTVIK